MNGEDYYMFMEHGIDTTTGKPWMFPPHSDPQKYEFALDFIFETPESALEWLLSEMVDGNSEIISESKDWALVHVTHEIVNDMAQHADVLLMEALRDHVAARMPDDTVVEVSDWVGYDTDPGEEPWELPVYVKAWPAGGEEDDGTYFDATADLRSDELEDIADFVVEQLKEG